MAVYVQINRENPHSSTQKKHMKNTQAGSEHRAITHIAFGRSTQFDIVILLATSV